MRIESLRHTASAPVYPTDAPHTRLRESSWVRANADGRWTGHSNVQNQQSDECCAQSAHVETWVFDVRSETASRRKGNDVVDGSAARIPQPSSVWE